MDITVYEQQGSAGAGNKKKKSSMYGRFANSDLGKTVVDHAKQEQNERTQAFINPDADSSKAYTSGRCRTVWEDAKNEAKLEQELFNKHFWFNIGPLPPFRVTIELIGVVGAEYALTEVNQDGKFKMGKAAKYDFCKKGDECQKTVNCKTGGNDLTAAGDDLKKNKAAKKAEADRVEKKYKYTVNGQVVLH